MQAVLKPQIKAVGWAAEQRRPPSQLDAGAAVLGCLQRLLWSEKEQSAEKNAGEGELWGRSLVLAEPSGWVVPFGCPGVTPASWQGNC